MAKEKHVLKVTGRETQGSAASRKARREGKIPAVVYGHGAEPKTFLLDVKEWKIIAKQDVQIVQLKPEKGSELNVFIKDVQFDYLKGITEHIDFLEVKMDEVITASVAIHAVGTPAGITQGGMLEQMLHDIEVSCTPLTLPEAIEVEVQDLELNDEINIKDIVLPEGVTALGDPEQTILHVIVPKVQEEAEEAEGAERVEGVEGAEGGEGAEAAAEGGGSEGDASSE